MNFGKQVVLMNGRIFESVESSSDASAGDHTRLIEAKLVVCKKKIKKMERTLNIGIMVVVRVYVTHIHDSYSTNEIQT